MTRPIDHSQAVILSGGGAYGAYEVGVMKALFTGDCPSNNYEYLNPGIFTGTSVGAFSASFLVSRSGDDICASIHLLESIWLDQVAENPQTCGNGVYRLRADPFGYFDPDCLASNPLHSFNEISRDGTFFARDVFKKTVNFLMSAGSLSDRTLELVDLSAFISTRPIRGLVSNTINLKNIRDSERVLRVVATNWDNGTVKVFANRDLTDEEGFAILRASASIPGIFHPTLVAGEQYVDGGLLMNTPLNCAIKAGANTLHVIYMDPDVKNIPISALQSTLNTMDRTMAISSANKVDQDVETASWINAGLEVIERTTQGQAPSNADLLAFIRVAGQIYEKLKAGSPYKKLTIHRYHPHDDLGGGSLALLNFNRERIDSLIKRGFSDAVNHDCAASHCVLPK
jgi:predicted acylesterase/phospholipase RssA